MLPWWDCVLLGGGGALGFGEDSVSLEEEVGAPTSK